MSAFRPIPEKPDHPALEEEMLALWEREGTFEKLVELNRGKARWSFVDGPITANNPMGVHHAWGRTLKDVFQRFKALQGHELRYQNGFDCQGLWVEVEVEKALGLNSKRDIEEYGLAEFTERCKERVAQYSEVITEQSKRLGMWMDWDNDYYTHADTNIEYIWRFLAEVHRRGWLYQGHRSTQWCPRCGTSLSQHEQAGEGNYDELEHPSLYVRFPLRERENESLVVWTTTPWTLPANVAAAVKPDAEYGLFGDEWWAVALRDGDSPSQTVRGEELVGLEYEGPFDELAAQDGVVHRVIPWDDVALDEGTGIVHIAPGCGAEDFELSREHDLAVIAPINESGIFYPGFGPFEGMSTDEVEHPVVERLGAEGKLVRAERIVHRYPICWRCRTPLVFRVVDDWFISVDEVRQPMLEQNATVAWTPEHYSRRMDDWLRNMRDWNISRKRYYGLPLPFYPCACGELTVVGSRAELEERAVSGIEGLRELHRPWIDDVVIACPSCSGEVRRIAEVGDAWLDAGIVPLSTLGWQNDEWKERGYATGASANVSGADLPDHAYWEQWFPADWVSEMREQIRLWFYSQCFMSVTLVGRSPYKAVLTYEKLLDETGREMHRSWGNAIAADEAFDSMGADVMRFMFCEAPPGQNIRFGYGPANEVKRRLLTLWNSISFFVTYARVAGFTPAYADLVSGPSDAQLSALDRWLLARVHALVAETTDAFDRFWTPAATRAFDSFVEDLSNWYIRRSRSRFWDGDEAALRTLWYALVQSLRAIAPVMPFLAEWAWQRLVREVAEEAPESVHLAGWPEVVDSLRDDTLLEEMAEVRDVVELGHQVRAEEGLRLRQPLAAAFVEGASLARGYGELIADELRVKKVVFHDEPHLQLAYKPNLPVLGPRLGKEVGAVREALARGELEELGDGRIRVAGHELGPGEVLAEPRDEPGWARGETVAVGLDLELDEELRAEGRVLDLIHALNSLRKEQGLDLTDRIAVTVPAGDADLLTRHADWIRQETLADRIEANGAALEITRV